ncbi:hypothetical protein [Microcoleus asticus]|nr:hypothetical protein [Microcoleus asticus]
MRSPFNPKLSKSAIKGRSDITLNKTGMEDTAMPFPYPKIIHRNFRM